MIVEPGFLDHWKTKMLVQKIGDPAAPLIVLRLWGHCQTSRRHRFKITPGALALICNWGAEPTQLLDALIECGFVERDGEELVVHDWDRHHPKFISNWENGAKGGRPRTQKTQKQIGFPARKPKPSFLPNLTKNNSFSVSDLLSDLKEGVRGRFQEWVVVRRSMGKAPKDWHRMFKEQVAWLERFTEADQLEILSASIRNNWQGLHEPRHGHVNGTSKPLSTFDIKERLKAIEDELGKSYWDRHKPEVAERRAHLQQKKKQLQHQLTT